MEANLSSIRTQRVVPVDLNALICANEASLATFFNLSGEGGREEAGKGKRFEPISIIGR